MTNKPNDSGLNENKLLKGGLSDGELKHIKEQRVFDEIEPGTVTWHLALNNDPLRIQMRNAYNVIAQRLWHIASFHAQANRLQRQIDSGVVVEKDKDGNFVHVDELKVGVSRLKWQAKGEAEAIPLSLSDLRGSAGHKDYGKQLILSVEAFDVFARETLAKVEELGYETVKLS